ncbi:MAG: ABC transporter permease [Thermoplasmata archaeon]
MAGDREPVRLGAIRRAGVLALLPVVAFVLAVGLLPPVLLFASALGTAGAGGLGTTLTDPVNAFAIENSVVQGGASAALAVAVGYPAGILLGRYDWPGRGVVRSLLLVPFLLPSVVVVVGVENLFGTGGWLTRLFPPLVALGHGLAGIVLVNVLFNAPLVALLTAVGVEGASTTLEDQAATLGAGPGRRFWDVWGPPSWIGAAAGAVLTFVFSALAFAAPLLLCGARCYTVEARVWALDQVYGLPDEGALLAFGLFVGMLAPTIAYGLLLQRLRAGRAGVSPRTRPLPWHSPSTWGLVAVALALLAGVVALLAAILARSVVPPLGGVSGSGWTALFGAHVTTIVGLASTGALVNTLLFATIASIGALLLGIVSGFGLRMRPRSSSFIGALAFAPVVVSPVVLSFSLASLYRPAFGGESTVWMLILLSQTALALPFALQSLFVPLRQLPHGPREAAQTLGSGPFAAYLDVELPSLRAGLVTASLFAFALSLGEFTATYFLATPRFTTLPVELYRLDALRQAAPANALAALLVLVSLGTLLAVALGGRRVEL